jgi:anti-sigma factor RsiW
MNCDAFEPRIKTWLDGELEPSQKEEVGKHVASCGACASAAADYREISKALGALGKEKMPLPSIELLEAKARAMERAEWAMIRSLQKVAALAAAVFLVALGTLLWNPLSTHPTAVASRDNVIELILGDSDWEEDY